MVDVVLNYLNFMGIPCSGKLKVFNQFIYDELDYDLEEILFVMKAQGSI